MTQRGPAVARRPTRLTLAADLVARARAQGVNISQAAEAGIVRALAEATDAEYATRHRAAMAAWSDYFEQHGLPLAEYRQF